MKCSRFKGDTRTGHTRDSVCVCVGGGVRDWVSVFNKSDKCTRIEKNLVINSGPSFVHMERRKELCH